ncbi:MAG TPA: hypothetical protein PLG73_09525 [Candidatus Sumerlaeota bacterium]|nr:hypothetical protein [Candidatus Sumerlaeota bacterium]
MIFFLHLLWRHVRQYPTRALAAVVVLTAASTIMLTLLGLGVALRFRLGDYLTELFPEEQLRLEARRANLGYIALENNPITPEKVAELKSLPGVNQVWSVEPLRFPIYATGSILGQELASDAVVHGVPRALVADSLPPDAPWRMPDDPDAPCPVIVSSYFLDLYNLGLARSSGLPALSPSALVGRDFTFVMGESVLGLGLASDVTPVQVRAKVVGLSKQPGMLGLAIPADIARAYNHKFAPGTPETYAQVVVQTARDADRQAILARAGEMGLQLAGGELLGEQLKFGVRLTGWAVIALALAIFALGMLTFYLLFTMIFHARRQDLIALRTLGLTPAQAVGLALGEVILLAATAVALALAATAGLAAWAGATMARWTEHLSWLPEDLLRPQPGWLLAGAALILGVTLLLATPMLRWVVTVRPAAVIRDR